MPDEPRVESATEPGSPSTGRTAVLLSVRESLRAGNLGRLAVVLVQFGLVIVLLRELDLLPPVIHRMLAIVGAGFLVHHFLPPRWRMKFFVGLSIGTTCFIAGAPTTAALVAIGAVLIGLAHVPAPFPVRAGLVAASIAVLAYVRSVPDMVPALEPVWPIVGSMFMFRMIIYLYDLKHRSAPFSPARAFAYLFMLPNVLFTVLPIVDYRTLCKTHLTGDTFETYQRGTWRILRGVVQLVLFRLILRDWMLETAEVVDGATAAQFLATTFLVLFLRLAGSFNIVIGLMGLFGFNLPPVYNNFLLASSFTEVWRRTNIYCKDFLLKVFFQPVLLPMRRRIGGTGALFVATAWTFLVTWILHECQAHWLRGYFPFRFQSMLFWGTLGTLICGNLYLEQRFGRRRLSRARTVGEDVFLALRTMGTFSTLISIWALKQTDTVADWVGVMSAFGSTSGLQLLAIVGALSLLGIGAVVEAHTPREKPLGSLAFGAAQEPRRFWKPAVIGILGSIALLVLAQFQELEPVSPTRKKPDFRQMRERVLRRGELGD